MNTKNFELIEKWLLASIIVLLPILFIPAFQNPFNTPKLIVAAVLTGLVLIVKGIKKIATKNPSVTFGTFDIPVLFFAGSFVISSIVATPNKMEAFWLPGVTSFVVIGAILYFIVNQVKDTEKKFFSQVLLISGGIFSFLSLFSVIGIFKGITALPQIMRIDGFNLSGSVLSGAIFLAVLIPLGIEHVRARHSMQTRALYGICLSVITLTLVALIGTLFTTAKIVLPGFGFSWIVATEALKNNAVFGVGPGNYLSAFSRFLPTAYNLTDLWSTRFANGQDFFLTMITENGLLGAAAIGLVIYGAVTTFRKSRRGQDTIFYAISLITLVLLMAAFPVTPVILVLLFILMALNSKGHSVHFGVEGEEGPAYLRIPMAIIWIPTFAVLGFLFLQLVNFTRAESYFNTALTYLGKNQGKESYETMQKAINIAPYVDRYHLTYAQLNLALANAVAQKKELTTEDRNTIGQLVQQAIREAKSAVALNPARSTYWETLAAIYRSVIPLAKDADQFAIQSYIQAIALDPTNPNLRVALGGIFYNAKRYDDAIDIYKLAVVAHPKHSNSLYNLAIAYREAGQYDKAVERLTQLLTIVAKDSEDYKLVTKELENVKSKQPKKETTEQTQNLNTPETKQTVLEPKIELPTDATPPATQAPAANQ